MWFCADLHLHSDRSSDCKVTPERVVEAAARRGISLIAFTDHHDLSAARAARTVARKLGVTVLPGVELSCPSGRSGVHVLGIFGPRLDEDRAIAELELDAPGLGNAGGGVRYEVAEAVERIQALGGLAIAAHANSGKGMFEECRGQALQRISQACRFDAIELAESRDAHRSPRLPPGFEGIPIISGSDAHELDDFSSEGHPYGVGSRPFWVNGPRRQTGFNALRWALSEPPTVASLPTLPGARGRQRIDHILRLERHFLRAVVDDSIRHRKSIVDAVVELLNADGGYVLVGVRRRFQGATRGASLTLGTVELHDLLVESIEPSPVLRVRRHRAANGRVHEIGILSTENPGRRYARREREQARGAAQADRAALEALGAFDVAAMTDRWRRRTRDGVLPVGDLVRLWPYRNWFVNDRALGELVAQSLVAHLIAEGEAAPRWLVLWSRESPRVRRALRDSYRALARRAATVDHRERLREALAESVKQGRLAANQRRPVEQWFERTQAELLAGEPALLPARVDLERARERAVEVFGPAAGADLDADAEMARAQYRAAMQEAYGAQAEVVLDASVGGDNLRVGDLSGAGIDRVIIGGGAGTGGGSGGELLVVPDRLSTLGPPQLLELWAQARAPDPQEVPALLRRCVEVGRHLPVLRLAGVMDRAELIELIDAIAVDAVGATVQRNQILKDLRSLLEPAYEPVATDHRAVFSVLTEAPLVEELRAASRSASQQPELLREVLSDSPTVRAVISRSARPGQKLTVRRPSIVLAGALNDTDLLEDWEGEGNPQVRLSLVEGISLLQHEPQRVDALLFEALGLRAGAVERAAKALAGRGPIGYDLLLERLPTDPAARSRVIAGVREVADEHPDRARDLARRACEDMHPSVLHEVRGVDRALYLMPARQRLTER